MKKLLVLLFFAAYSNVLNAQGNEYFYDEAYNTLTEMLTDSTKYSFKKAVFTTENAFKQGTLDTAYYNLSIKTLSNLSEAIVKANDLKDYNFKDKHLIEKSASIFKIMRDSIEINFKKEKGTWIPFRYDFNDIWGDNDWSNMFVSKLIDTHKGNCHSLPYLYKILAEEIGIKAYLALSPNHVYIKQKSLKDGWYNTELTSGFFPIDAWIMASGYVHLDGIKNGLYMKALNNNETIALVLTDLAQGYEKQFAINDGTFILKCCEAALQQYPNLINALLLKLETTKKKLEYLAEREKKPIDQILEHPKASEIWVDLNKQVQFIHELGYRQMPKEMYLDWLLSLKEEKEKYRNKKINTFAKPK